MTQHPKHYQNTPTQLPFIMKDGYKGAQETKKTLKKLYTVRPCHDIRPWPNTYYKQEIMTENSSPKTFLSKKQHNVSTCQVPDEDMKQNVCTVSRKKKCFCMYNFLLNIIERGNKHNTGVNNTVNSKTL